MSISKKNQRTASVTNVYSSTPNCGLVRRQLRRLPSQKNTINVNQYVVKPVTVARDLDVWFDAELSMRSHVSRVAQTCFYHLHLDSTTARPRRYSKTTVWVKKVAPLKLFAIFSLMVNLCNWKLPWPLPKHIPMSTPILVHLSEYLYELYHFYRAACNADAV